MNNKRIGIIFVILFLLAALPFPFTAGVQTFLFGWLPASLAYWWVLMIINLVFVLVVCKKFVESSKAETTKKEGDKK